MHTVINWVLLEELMGMLRLPGQGLDYLNNSRSYPKYHAFTYHARGCIVREFPIALL